jgi:pimeloyl-ACP methyl ester carboxylesterase
MIIAFHGCPWLPTDFDAISKALGMLPGAPSLHAVIRKGYPGATRSLASSADGTHYLGYSFGSADCVEAAAQDPAAKSVILIAPYLFPTKEAGVALKGLLSLPILSSALLSILGPKAMAKFAIKTAYPDAPSKEYRATSQAYAKPAILRTAMTETSGRAPGIRSALAQLEKRKLPILVIWAKQDQVSPEADQIQPLRKIIPQLQELALDSAGHALLWTKPSELAKAIQSFTQKISGGSI